MITGAKTQREGQRTEAFRNLVALVYVEEREILDESACRLANNLLDARNRQVIGNNQSKIFLRCRIRRHRLHLQRLITDESNQCINIQLEGT